MQQAYYTEPADQSAWLYHRWLLGRVVATGTALPIIGIAIGVQMQQQPHDDPSVQSSSNLTAADHEAEAAAPPATPPARSSDADLQRQSAVFSRELDSVQQLLEVEPDCKWALLTSAILSAGLAACKRALNQQQETDQTQLRNTLRDIFQRLLQLDPMRTNYYNDVRDRIMQTQDEAPPQQQTLTTP